MVTVREAIDRVVAAVSPLPAELVPLREAVGRVLASDARSEIALPRWDNASMDGYAVRADDVRTASPDAPVMLPVLETVAAGRQPTQRVRAGTAIRIMTGAPVPEGADSVIRVEDTDGGVERVVIRSARDAGRNVRPRGEDLEAGDIAVSAGTLIGPAQLGVLASIGAAKVDVHRRPHVALLATGDELVDVDQFDAVRRGERIVSSNSYTLWAALRDAGAAVLDLGVARDDPDDLRTRLERGRSCDLLVTSGGISAGAFDHTRTVLEALGAEVAFHRVRMRPGAPVGFGTLGGVPWIGLPGNPVSSLVTHELFARPAVRRLAGARLLFPRPITVIVDEPIELAAPLMHFFRVVMSGAAGDTPHVRLTGPQGSGLLTSLSRADALLMVPAERMRIAAGERATVIPLGEGAQLSDTPMLP